MRAQRAGLKHSREPRFPMTTMTKPLLGVVHLRPTPHAASFHQAAQSREPATAVMAAMLKAADQDALALVEGGVDGLMIENYGDVPFHRGDATDPVPPDAVAALALVAHQLREKHGVPVGINCLRNDVHGALGAAAVAGARWVRANVWTGASVTDQGLIQGVAASAMTYRQQLGCDAEVLADLFVKHASPLAPCSLSDAARDLATRSGAAGLILSGTHTGAPVAESGLREVREAVGDFPIWIGSGLNAKNAASLWPLCDGAIVGTSVKVDGQVNQPVDPGRVAALRAVLR